ncbi:hypothetical protein BAG01nite_25590 [Brevibacillus agri]|uniref:Uncharacterized protein n=1 Tax=Brevibacillus agri TaxID=51101 RepID=A0ABQ0SRD6_9BACL|nr:MULTISPECIES: hypothetical protein [Brevibacillus]ELK40483.1 hypothetical protein D478_18849 [Brevibacillus agri BAB-2500]EJL43295.1 surface antigen repeat containing protein [Brevibacillus sp. CF112]MBY0054503.1 hypothetical protein [Brevibacillus agri]MCG5250957.1 hypothetical protein [Brevibacillus agri]MDN4092157.1 hypothetical protein [Brevibacillus agri]
MTTQAMQEKISKMEAELKRLQAELAKINKTTPQFDRNDVAYLNEVYNG